ncbi:MAG: glycerate kinase [Eubacterium sp.]|nr:glycerate kinase [Eubacterium sp.]
MKLVFASDSFKGSLSSERTAQLLTKAAEEIFGETECFSLPVADGGEGTLEAVVSATGGGFVEAWARDPMGNPRRTHYGVTGDGRAIIEMAAASGLTLVPAEQRDPESASSYGTGELIQDALARGYHDVSVAIGGSATNDGGMGCARALGIRFLDERGQELDGIGSDLGRVHSIDMERLDPRLAGAALTVMCDVTNPLCGPDGATQTFGAQKGASQEALQRLEEGMCHYRDVLLRTFGKDADQMPGAGAAGGLGAALMILLGANMRSGIETVLDLIGFGTLLKEADLVITGEGRTDWQSCHGKVMQGIGEYARRRGVPVIGLSGSLGPGADQILAHGITALTTTVNAPMDLDEAMERAEELYLDAARNMFRMVKVGMKLGK